MFTNDIIFLRGGGGGSVTDRGDLKILLALLIVLGRANVISTVNYVSAVLEQEGGPELKGAAKPLPSAERSNCCNHSKRARAPPRPLIFIEVYI